MVVLLHLILLVLLVPGVNMKTWNIFPLDDGLEENHETFSITLKSPQNAVLGQRTSATVEIIDPRGGGVRVIPTPACRGRCGAAYGRFRVHMEPADQPMRNKNFNFVYLR